MGILLEQWGYTCSLNNVEARLWLCFKGIPLEIQRCIELENQRRDAPTYIFSRGFFGYWK
jgi:hypothetical protein